MGRRSPGKLVFTSYFEALPGNRGSPPLGCQKVRRILLLKVPHFYLGRTTIAF